MQTIHLTLPKSSIATVTKYQIAHISGVYELKNRGFLSNFNLFPKHFNSIKIRILQFIGYKFQII